MAQTAECFISEIVCDELVRKHYRMQHGRMISGCDEAPYGLAVHSEVSSVAMWNHFAWLGGPESAFADFARSGEAACLRHGRRPALYFISPEHEPASASALLPDWRYELFDRESWLIYDRTSLADDSGTGHVTVRQAQAEQQIDEFLAIFCAAFQIRDPAFISLLRRQALEAEHAASVRHFVGYSDGTPACVGTLISSENDCCIYNVGTVPGARNRGYGSALISHLIHHARAGNSSLIFLQTAQGSAAERLYLRHGFKPGFIRQGFRLMDWPGRPRDRTKLGNAIRVVPDAQRISSSSRSAAQSQTELKHRSERFTLPDGLLADLHSLAQQARVSIESVLIAGWVSLLARRTRDEIIRVVIRTARDGDAAPPSEMVPLALPAPESESIRSWIQFLEQQRTDASHQAALTDAVDCESAICFCPLERKRRVEISTPLAISFAESDPAHFRVHYHPGSLSRSPARQIGRRFILLLEQIAAQPDAPAGSLEILTSQERDEMLALSASPTLRQAGPFQSVVQLFEIQAARSPDTVALLHAGDLEPAKYESWTYAQLNEKANQLAHHLRALGAGPDTYVGLCLDQPLDRVLGLVAVLKSGGASVPLDPEQPSDRLAFVIHDTRMPLLITTKSIAARLPETPATVVCLDSAWPTIAGQIATNPTTNISAETAAYIIFTSGSTGAPKGVLVSHYAIARHCLDAQQHYGLNSSDCVLQFAAFHFDAAFEQVLPPLLSGATVVLRGSEIWKPGDFDRHVARCELTVVDLPTAYWHQLVKHWADAPESIQPRSLRLVIVGGEAMLPETVRLWRQTPLRHVRLLNAYGPTEATITATTFELNQWNPPKAAPYAPVPIGRPRAHRIAYILDRYSHLAPVGLAGELCIGGDLLARGYLNRPELTKEKFVPDPFRPPGARLYHTGDLARYLPDGNLEFLGRLDDQVKIRGFRIELGEIETVLTQHARIKSAVVTMREIRPGEKSLVAYVVPDLEHPPTEPDLRFYLKQKLPDYMVPAGIVILESLPLTTSGKVDRRALPSPETLRHSSSTTVKGPSDPLELRLLLLVEKVLRRCPLGVDMSFFELGGDSLQALELIVAIERATGRSLPLETLYQSSTVEGLARILHDPGTHAGTSALVPLQPQGVRPPFFLIHTTPGDVLGYGNLIFHLNSEQPCYGIQSRGLVDIAEAHHRIEDMAAFYIEQMRTVQPRGPYYLGGWCYGGIVAVEMANQLFAEDEDVALLALFETLAPAPSWRIAEYYAHRFRCFFKMPPKLWLGYLARKWKYVREIRLGTSTRFHRLGWGGDHPSDAKTDRGKLAQLEFVYEQNLKALGRYRSTPYPGRVTLFNAEQIEAGMIPDRYYGWIGLAAEIEIHIVPGSHETMLAEPHAAVLAQELETCLRRTQNRSRRPGKPVSR